MVAETLATSFAAQFTGQMSERDRQSRPIKPWHLNPALKSRAARQAEEMVARLSPKRRRNPVTALNIKR